MPNDEQDTRRIDDDDDDFWLAALIPQYFDLCRRDLLNLQAALENGDFERIRVVGHNLKGSGGAYGFPELTALGAQFESAGTSGDGAVVRHVIDELSEFLKNNKR